MITEALKPALAFAAIASLLGGLSGCVDKSNPDTIDRRAVERWNDLIAHQAEKAYDYLTPGYRLTQTREAYAATMNDRPVRWDAAKFKQKTCEAERCKVEVEVTFSMKVAGSAAWTPATSTQTEIWILSGGEWFYLPNT